MPSPQPSSRLASLDVFRGATIAAMIVANNPGDQATAFPILRHASWNGCTPTDWIFPFFLFIIGVALTCAFAGQAARGLPTRTLIFQAARRAVLLIGLGLLVNTFPFGTFNPATFRIPGVLQRIAVCYFLAFLVMLATGPRGQAATAAAILAGYWLLMTRTPVPGHGAGVLDAEHRGANFGAFIDRMLAGRHLGARTFDITGLFGSLPGVAQVLLGAMAGHVLQSRAPAARKAMILVACGLALTAFGWVWGGCPGRVGCLNLGEATVTSEWVFPVNKPLWTSSFVLFTSGLGYLGLAGCYAAVDLSGRPVCWFPLIALGRNAILLFVLPILVHNALAAVHVMAANGHETTVWRLAYDQGFAPWFEPAAASLFFALTYLLFWVACAVLLYRRNLFWRI